MAEPVPLMMYWPTYDQMTAAQKKWYFYWRSELRLKRFLPTDLSYLFVHIYEIISLVGFSSAQVAFEHLVNFWQHYRQLQPKLDNYLVDWIADFIVVHNLDLTPLQWYANALALGYYMGDQELLLEAWSKMGKEYSDIPSNLLYRLGNYSVSNNKFYQSHRNELFLDVQLKLGVESIDRYLQSKENRSLFCPTDPATTRQIRRAPFASALHDYKRQEIVITDVHAWLGDEKFSGIIKSILKQSENLLRERAGYRSKLRGIELPADWIEILEKTFSIKHGSSVFAEQNSQPAFTIDMASVELLRRESETVRARLKVLEDVENEETSSSVIIDTTTTTKVLIDTTIPLETGETTYIQRPENTPPGLLTDLVPIAEIMGPHDAPTAKILSALRHNEWQATLAVLGQAVPDSFVNVILDEINESSYNQIGDALVFNESGIWVVADDFRDEISYILDHPSYAKEDANEIKAESTELSSTDTFLELSSEFSDFASRMQSYHWQALDVLMCDIDVSLKLDSIARTVHSTANRLIDDINEYALESVGDIVIDVSVGVPRIEQEDIEGLNLLLTWANRHDLIKG